MSGNRSIGGIKRRGSLARAAAAGLVTACCLLSLKVLSAQSAAAARAQSEDREPGIVVATVMEERARVEPVDYEDAIARARVEYEEAVRLMGRRRSRATVRRA